MDACLEPSGNFEIKHLKQQVYEEMKNNNISAKHLIEILQFDEKEKERDTEIVGEEPDAHDDIVSQYTT